MHGDEFCVVSDGGCVVLVLITRWYYCDGSAWPIEGVDANGSMHTMGIGDCEILSPYTEIEAA